METSRLLQYLAGDRARLRNVVAAADPAARVPGCPGWSRADLVRHLAAAYLRRAECMRLNRPSEPWPPPGITPTLAGQPGRVVRMEADGPVWLVRLTDKEVRVTESYLDQADAAAIRGRPAPALLWLWNRAADGGVSVDGDPALVDRLRRVLVVATQ